MSTQLTEKAVPVSCLVLTYNEEVNLHYCLSSLSWCSDIVVIDSFSTDKTREVAASYGARFYQHEFTGFGDQRNYCFENISFRHSWVLVLDADERVPKALVSEMSERISLAAPDVAAFRIKRKFFLWGKWLRYSSLYPTYVVRLVKLGKVRYLNCGHGETQLVDGVVDELKEDLHDENHKPLFDWWERHNRYSDKEANYDLSFPKLSLRNLISRNPLDRRETVKSIARHIPARALLYFIYSYIFKKGFLDGLAGFYYCLMKAMYHQMVQIKKYEMRLSSGQSSTSTRDRRKKLGL